MVHVNLISFAWCKPPRSVNQSMSSSSWCQVDVSLAQIETQVMGFHKLGWNWAIRDNANMLNLGSKSGWSRPTQAEPCSAKRSTAGLFNWWLTSIRPANKHPATISVALMGQSPTLTFDAASKQTKPMLKSTVSPMRWLSMMQAYVLHCRANQNKKHVRRSSHIFKRDIVTFVPRFTCILSTSRKVAIWKAFSQISSSPSSSTLKNMSSPVSVWTLKQCRLLSRRSLSWDQHTATTLLTDARQQRGSLTRY